MKKLLVLLILCGCRRFEGDLHQPELPKEFFNKHISEETLPDHYGLVIKGPKSTLTTVADRQLNPKVTVGNLIMVEIKLDQSDIDCITQEPPPSPK